MCVCVYVCVYLCVFRNSCCFYKPMPLELSSQAWLFLFYFFLLACHALEMEKEVSSGCIRVSVGTGVIWDCSDHSAWLSRPKLIILNLTAQLKQVHKFCCQPDWVVGWHYAMWNKPVTEGQIPHDSIYIPSIKQPNSQKSRVSSRGSRNQGPVCRGRVAPWMCGQAVDLD